jgi:uncharacterized DUF497 family protein
LYIYFVLWKDQFIEKLLLKHNVTTDEVEEVLFGNSLIRFWEKGSVAGENLYVAYGQANSGRYLIVFFYSEKRRCGNAYFC